MLNDSCSVRCRKLHGENTFLEERSTSITYACNPSQSSVPSLTHPLDRDEGIKMGDAGRAFVVVGEGRARRRRRDNSVCFI